MISSAEAGEAPQAKPFEEQTSTMIVFPQGGVLKMSMSVSAGQVMVLTNLKSRQDAIGRVVKVRAFAKDQSYVEIEFTSPQPGYWGVYFPSDGPEVSRVTPHPAAVPDPAPVAPSAQRVQPEASIERKNGDNSSPAPVSLKPPAAKVPEPTPRAGSPAVAPPRAPAPLKLPQSSFTSLGTQEDVLAPADSTRGPRATSFPSGPPAPQSSPDSDISDAIDAMIIPAARPSSAPAPNRAAAVEKSPVPSGLDADHSIVCTKPMLTYGVDPEPGLPLPKQMFGVALDAASPVSGNSSRSSGSKTWIPIGIVALLALGAAGAYYFYFQPTGPGGALSSTASAAPAPAPQPMSHTAGSPSAPAASTVPTTPAESASTNSTLSNSGPSSSVMESQASDRSNNNFDSRAPRHAAIPGAAESEAQPSVLPQPKVAIPSTAGVLKARPVIRRFSKPSSIGAAPALDVANGPVASVASLGAIAPPPPSLPAPPKPVSTAPIRVGGKIQPPRLVSSVLPVYPPIARQANITGTVVIDTTIDKDGNVAKTRVISGPELLRAAALSALRQWKYEPSKLNGQPISVEMIVSIQFH